jgi:hypothetical protein
MDIRSLPILKLSYSAFLSHPSFEFASTHDGETLAPTFRESGNACGVPPLRRSKACNHKALSRAKVERSSPVGNTFRASRQSYRGNPTIPIVEKSAHEKTTDLFEYLNI